MVERVSNTEEKRLDVKNMSKDRKGRKVAPAKGIEATKDIDEWRKECQDCEISKIEDRCDFGCERLRRFLKDKRV